MILDKEITYFKNTRDLEAQNDGKTVGYFLEAIQTGSYKDQIERLREGDVGVKLHLPTIAFHGIFEFERKKKDFIESTGIIILDIDDVEKEDLEDTKEEIFEDESVIACMISPSGNGIKVLYHVDPDLINADTYRQIGKEIVQELEIYGNVDYLSITDCMIATYDENLYWRDDSIPRRVLIENVKEIKKELDPLDKSRELWEDPEDFFDTVLANDIAEKTNNNFHFIQVAVLDLAKFGFKHPEYDLSFVIDYSEENFKHSADNKKRFLEVAELAKDYPQQMWPYKIIKSTEEEDDYVDYSDYTNNKEEEDEEQDTEGLINYDTFFDSVLKVIEEGDRVGYEVSLSNFADIFRFKGTGILTVTGIPGHGKTEFVDQLIVDLARHYGHETIVAGFEQTPEEHVIKLMRKMMGVNITCSSFNDREGLEEAYEFVTTMIKHIDTTKSGGNINNILEITAQRIKKSRDEGGNPRYVVIDPFNMLSIKGKHSGHEKIEEILRRLTHFSHQMDVQVILVAHPFKMKVEEETGKYKMPDFYSVKGSSAFFEMSYHGLVVYRTGYSAMDTVIVKVLKVKQNNLGTAGEQAMFQYEKNSGRYIPIDSEGAELSGDHRKKDWMDKIEVEW